MNNKMKLIKHNNNQNIIKNLLIKILEKNFIEYDYINLIIGIGIEN